MKIGFISIEEAQAQGVSVPKGVINDKLLESLYIGDNGDITGGCELKNGSTIVLKHATDFFKLVCSNLLSDGKCGNSFDGKSYTKMCPLLHLDNVIARDTKKAA